MKITVCILVLFSVVCCSRKTIPVNSQQISYSDSIIIQSYKHKIMRLNVEDSALTNAELDTIYEREYSNNTRFQYSGVKYSPDGKFKIYTIELESCGAYCNSEWFSWIHYKNKKQEIIKEVAFSHIDTIIRLSDNKYLIIDEYGARPASVLTTFCQSADLVLLSDSLISHKIKYRKDNHFGYCQENSVELENESRPYIKYENGLLKYYYGNNYAYSDGVDIDTIRKGQFRYLNGEFFFDKEEIKINNRENIQTSPNTH